MKKVILSFLSIILVSFLSTGTTITANVTLDVQNDTEITTGSTNSYTVSGTVFPFVNTGVVVLDELFIITAGLYNLPTSGDPLREIQADTPLYADTLVLYDGSVYVPGTPKYPGTITSVNNPGIPITWSMIGKNPGYIDETEVNEGEKPESPVGLYTFENVSAGEYLLVISRAGFINRYAKVNIQENSTLGHRELIAGDINIDGSVSVMDLTLLNARMSAFCEISYNAGNDFNADGLVGEKDIDIIRENLGASLIMYTDTYDWLINYELHMNYLSILPEMK